MLRINQTFVDLAIAVFEVHDKFISCQNEGDMTGRYDREMTFKNLFRTYAMT